MTRRRIITWVSLAVALGLAIATGITGVGAHDDAAALRADAMAALQLKEGDCVVAANPLLAEVDRAALRDKESTLGGRPGWVAGVFFGKADDLAADLKGSVEASGSSIIWVLVEDDDSGRKAVNRYSKVDLDSGGSAWLASGSMRTIKCDEAE
jgi:hypothetical protein